MIDRVDVRGVPVSAATKEQVDQLVLDWIETGHKAYVCCANVHVAETARRDEALSAALQHADLVLADGAPLAWLASRKSGSPVPRVTGSDLFRLFAVTGSARTRHFFFGSTDETLRNLISSVRQANPDIEIVGSFSPPFDQRLFSEVDEHADRINAARPDFVWVGLGAPKQELWMQRARPLLDASVLVGVGAVFDFARGGRVRAPSWVQRAGLEWLFRLAQEPRRLGPRYVATNTSFILGVARDLLGRRS